MTYANKHCSLCYVPWSRQRMVTDPLDMRRYARSTLCLGNQGSDIDNQSNRRCLGCHLAYLIANKVNLVSFMANLDIGLFGLPGHSFYHYFSQLLGPDGLNWYMGIGVLNSGYGDKNYINVTSKFFKEIGI